MARLDHAAPNRLLRLGYQPDDWVAIFLKSYRTGTITQRIAPLSLVTSARFQAWLRARNAHGWNVYVSTNAVRPRGRSRARSDIWTVRHVFLEADVDGCAVLARLADRPDLPQPSYLLHSSRNRVHIFWSVEDFDVERLEALQKQLARELGTDTAATSASQLTRLPGFFNNKYTPPYLVSIVYGQLDRPYMPADFPAPPRANEPPQHLRVRPAVGLNRTERVRKYLEVSPPAIAGQHGDLRTFRVCCRLVRGFALSDSEALPLLRAWNARCEPPWSESELCDKLRRARRYGREPVGGLLSSVDGVPYVSMNGNSRSTFDNT
jgi:hypothetical protein